MALEGLHVGLRGARLRVGVKGQAFVIFGQGAIQIPVLRQTLRLLREGCRVFFQFSPARQKRLDFRDILFYRGVGVKRAGLSVLRERVLQLVVPPKSRRYGRKFQGVEVVVSHLFEAFQFAAQHVVPNASVQQFFRGLARLNPRGLDFTLFTKGEGSLPKVPSFSQPAALGERFGGNVHFEAELRRPQRQVVFVGHAQGDNGVSLGFSVHDAAGSVFRGQKGLIVWCP